MSAMRCVDCGKEFDVDMPQHEVINQMTVSMVVFAHPQLACCPHCGTAYRFEVAGLKSAVFGFKKFELPKQEDASRILVPDLAIDFSKLKKN